MVGINTLSHTGILPSGMLIPISSANLITLLRLLSVGPLPQLRVSMLNFWNISIPVLSSFHVVAAWIFFDAIWLIVVIAFVIVLVGMAAVLGMGVFTPFPSGSVQLTKTDTILTVLMSVISFLAGLLSPSPVSKKS